MATFLSDNYKNRFIYYIEISAFSNIINKLKLEDYTTLLINTNFFDEFLVYYNNKHSTQLAFSQEETEDKNENKINFILPYINQEVDYISSHLESLNTKYNIIKLVKEIKVNNVVSENRVMNIIQSEAINSVLLYYFLLTTVYFSNIFNKHDKQNNNFIDTEYSERLQVANKDIDLSKLDYDCIYFIQNNILFF